MLEESQHGKMAMTGRNVFHRTGSHVAAMAGASVGAFRNLLSIILGVDHSPAGI